MQITLARRAFVAAHSWLAACGLAAVLLASPGARGGLSNCCFPNGSAGCDDRTCEGIVCDVDPFCCDVQWDSVCAGQAEDLCGDLCAGGPGGCPGEGDCCSANGTPACDDVTCCEVVCAADAFCCESAWDAICAGSAIDLCDTCSAGTCPGEGSCCTDNGTPGCDDEACCELVCADDVFCCDTIWDGKCANDALTLCGDLCASQCPGAGDCCAPNGTPGCDDQACCDAVCSNDPECCTAIWDQICVQAAGVLCATCGGGPGGDCCKAHGTPGCDDRKCQDIICAIDPFCCDTEWDQICVDEAFELCGDLCFPCPAQCEGDMDGSGTVDGADLGLLLGAWDTDDPCANLSRDGTVDGNDLGLLLGAWGACPTGPCPGPGDCFEANGTPGCDDQACCEAVCRVDPFCCDTEWDQICADGAMDICEMP